MENDYYQILGISKTATEAEIKRAYRKLAHQYHPDKGGGDEKKFKKISEAYQILSDPEKRKQYDQFGKTFDYESGFSAQGGPASGWDFSNFGFGGFSAQGGPASGWDFSNLGDIFDVFFGGEREREARGRDIERNIAINFEDAFKGANIPLEIEKNIICPRCRGDKAEPGTEKITCPECKGQGKKETVKTTILGQFKSIKTCEKCRGAGRIPKIKCRTCQGEGIKREKVRHDVVIPAGIKDGMTVRVAGAGEATPSGHQGDLYLEVKVKEHPQFQRINDDILYNLNINFSEAALGDTIGVPIIEGTRQIKIPAGSQSGEEIRLRGLGFPHLNHFGSGDEVIKIKVITPKNLNQEQRKLFEELKRIK